MIKFKKMVHKIIKCKKCQNGKRTIRNEFMIDYFYIVTIYLIFPFLISKNEEPIYNIITVKINKTGNISIFYPYYNYPPDIVEINGINQTKISFEYYFDKTENIVRLIWKNNLGYIPYLFYGCDDIIELNLSQFNTSQVYNMFQMFEGCSSLKSLDLSHFDSSSVIRMDDLFNGCSSLESLDLSHFKTSSVKKMDGMFYGCIKLKYINLSNFDIRSTITTSNMFSFTPENMLIYSNNEGWSNLLLNYTTLFIYCNNKKSIPNFSLRYESNKFNILNPYIRMKLCEICDMDSIKTEINFTNNDNFISIYLSYNDSISKEIHIIMNKTELMITNYLTQDYSIIEETHYIINRTEEIEKIIKLLISQKNRTDLNNGMDTEILKDNILITFSTTHNQKNNNN